MKKLTAVILSLVLVLALVCTAAAESRTFALAGITDNEGNVIPTEELPESIITIDDETMTSSYETAEAVEEGTCELLSSDADTQTAQIRCVFSEDTIDFTWDGENDMLYLADPVNNIIYVYVRVEPTAAE